MRKILYILLLCVTISSQAQNNCTPYTVANNTINLFCGQNCFTYSVPIPNIRSTDDYKVETPTFAPAAYSGGTAVTSIYVDDKFSALIPLPFTFCFYGSNYSSVVIGSNGVITFDATVANGSNAYPLQTGTTPIPIPYAGGTFGGISPAYYPKASIMGAYHDIDPSVTTSSPNKRIEYRVDGTAPCRRFVVSFFQIPMFSSTCNAQLCTSQIILYEGLGIVDVPVANKPLCTGWNDGLAILGVQNFNRDKAVAAPGKNCTQWTATNEQYRFLPSGTTSLYQKVELLNGTTVVAIGDTATINGVFTAVFPSTCQTVANQVYTVRVTYKSCLNNTDTYTITGNLTVNRSGNSNITASTTTTAASCTQANGGSITITPAGGVTPYQYSLNNGAFQTSNTFTNLTQGNYSIKVKDAANCETTITAIISFNNNLTLTKSNDTAVCNGQPAFLSAVSNSLNTTFTWSPTTGLNASNGGVVMATPNSTTPYTVTANLNGCTRTATVNVTVIPLPDANAGPDFTIIEGDDVQLQGFSNTATSFTWSPANTLTGATTYTPTAKPLVTTTYTLAVRGANNCTATDQAVVTVIPYCIKVLKAFTPNGDGLNDRWLVTTSFACVKQIKANVYNRYGGNVFSNENYQNNWDGKFNGNPVADGTYYYVLEFTLINNKKLFFKGDVTILR